MKSSYLITVTQDAPAFKVSLRRVRETSRKILKALGLRTAELNILLADDRRIRVLNRKFLRHDRPTDVIAFGQGAEKGDTHLRRVPPFSGDLVISLETTERQALEYGNPFFYELAFYVCHGILHLLGWEDRTRTRRLKMWKKQETILKKIGIVRGHS